MLSIAIISLTFTVVYFIFFSRIIYQGGNFRELYYLTGLIVGIIIITVINKKHLKEPVKWIVCVIIFVIIFLGFKILCDLLFEDALINFYSSGYRNLLQYPRYLVDRKSW